LDIHVYLKGKKTKIYLHLNKDGLYKHGDKLRISEAPIREDLAYVMSSELMEKIKETKNIKIWDAFCGSGSLIFSFMNIYFNSPIRMNLDDKFWRKIPTFPVKEYQEYKI
jgi:23S rRNA G2445 N2-methylase RlmL